LDLRNSDLFNEEHILNSINIAQKDFDVTANKIKQYKKNIIILLADTDNNAAAIGTKLQKNEFTNIHILSEGLQAWRKANLPTVKK
ncbi:MAG: hypothetical protein ACD_26C00066G0001, partial [uncultured bacterium]